LGIVIALLMVGLGVRIYSPNPWYTPLVFILFGTIAGLLLGGFAPLGPHDYRLIDARRQSRGERRWLVVVHARDRTEERMARDVLNGLSEVVTSTF
jgi:hypothetical protein